MKRLPAALTAILFINALPTLEAQENSGFLTNATVYRGNFEFDVVTPAPPGSWTLQTSTGYTGPWTTFPGLPSPPSNHVVVPVDSPTRFFRILWNGSASANVAGYHQFLLRSGYSMIANQFSRGSNTLEEVLPAVPEGSLLYKFDANRQTWGNVCQFRFNLWDQPTVTLTPGEGCVFRNPRADFFVILAGVVWPNTSKPPLVRGLNIISIPVPDVDPDPILSASGTAYFLHTAGTNSNDYTAIIHMGGFEPDVQLNIGESFWEFAASAPSSTNVAPPASIVYLNNYVPAAGINAAFFGIAGCLLQDTNWLAELLAGPDVLSLAPVGDQLSFLTGIGAGYLDTSRGAVRYIPTVQPGAPVFCQVRVWDSSDGATTYAAATRKLESNAFQVTTGGSGTPPSLPSWV